MFLKIDKILVDVDKYKRIYIEDAYMEEWSRIMGDGETIVYIKRDKVQGEFDKISDALALRYFNEIQ